MKSFITLCLFAALWSTGSQADERQLELSSGNEILIHTRGEAKDRILWIPSEFGYRAQRAEELAGGLAEQGYSIWTADLHSSYFLPPGRDSYSEVSTDDIAELISRAQPDNGRLYILSTGRGAALSLMAARVNQLQRPHSTPLGGLILFHPNLHAQPPQPGYPTIYLPVTSQSNLPIYLFQPANSAKRWHLASLMKQLEQGGSDLFVQLIPETSDGFHIRSDFTPREAVISRSLPAMISNGVALLDTVNQHPRLAADITSEDIAWSGKAFKETLQRYPGQPLAPPLRLKDTEGSFHALEAYRGKVVLLNFWATWCPPCVEEIPSLGRLQAELPIEDFVVLSVDLGEDANTVNAFLQKVPARFPVLLDVAGSSVDAWNIRAFPTTFLIDRQGHIRYAYFGALEWDDESVVSLIRDLAQEG